MKLFELILKLTTYTLAIITIITCYEVYFGNGEAMFLLRKKIKIILDTVLIILCIGYTIFYIHYLTRKKLEGLGYATLLLIGFILMPMLNTSTFFIGSMLADIIKAFYSLL